MNGVRWPWVVFFPEDADECQDSVDLSQVQDLVVVKPDDAARLVVERGRLSLHRHPGILFFVSGERTALMLLKNLPVYAADVDHQVDHVAAELVALHVHRRGVGGDVDLGHDVEQESFLGIGVLMGKT